MSTGPRPAKPWCAHHKRVRAPHELSPRNARHVLWARRARAWLIAKLGGKCWEPECSATEELEFDHLKPRDWEPRKKSRWQRMVLYIRDYKRGLAEGEPRLGLRCRACNARKGYPKGQLELLDGTHAPKSTSPNDNTPF